MEDRTILDDQHDEYIRVWKQVKAIYKQLGFYYHPDHTWAISLLDIEVRERYNISLWGKEISDNSPCEHNANEEPMTIHNIIIYGNCFDFDCLVKSYERSLEAIKEVRKEMSRPAEWIINILQHDYESSIEGTYPEKPAGLINPTQITLEDILKREE